MSDNTMFITSPDPKVKVVEEYDFTFSSGIFMPITIDVEAGDLIDLDSPDVIKVHLSKKPNPRELGVSLPAEDMIIYVKNLLTMQHRQKEVTELTEAQKMEWTRTLQEMASNTIQ